MVVVVEVIVGMKVVVQEGDGGGGSGDSGNGSGDT